MVLKFLLFRIFTPYPETQYPRVHRYWLKSAGEYLAVRIRRKVPARHESRCVHIEAVLPDPSVSRVLQCFDSSLESPFHM
jgi:hypothetical protein